MAKDQINEVMEHFARGFAALIALAGSGVDATVVLQPKSLRTDEAATYIGVSRSRFFELKSTVDEHKKPKKPEIPTTIVDGQPRYLLKHLDKYLSDCEKRS